MGKSEDEQPTPSHQAALQGAAAQNAGARCASCRLIGRIARPRCVASLVLSLALLLSVVFWLPPFVRRSEGSGRPDKDPRFTADIVASFKLQKPVALLSSNIGKLQVDIFEEIGVPDSSVAIIYLEPLSGLNWTNVVFGVWPYPKSSTLSSTGLSILRASLMSLVIRQSSLHLTSSLFGNSSFFEVLKFPGGITIIPFQKAFLLQKVQMLFNFTLNFPIYQVQDRIDELEDQMKAGLLLNSNENLYIKLTNRDGSTVAPPTIVQTSIVLAVGNRQPSLPRWKELAQTIRNSSAGNLGLNHTLFGRVKQIRLSSFAQHSFNSGGDTASPSPAPQPKPNHHPHHPHHPHHHYKHHFPMHHAPGPASDTHDHRASAPSGCRYGFSSKPKSIGYLTPAAAPADAPKLSAAAPAAVKRHSTRPVSSPHHFGAPLIAPQHLHAPRAHEKSSAPAPNIKSASPLPAVSFTHQQPPSESITDNKPPDGTSSISPAPNTSSASGRCFVHLVFAPLLYSLLSLVKKESFCFSGI